MGSKDYSHIIEGTTVELGTGLVGVLSLQHLSTLLHLARFADFNQEYFDGYVLNEKGIEILPTLILERLLMLDDKGKIISFALNNMTTKKGIKASKLGWDKLPSTLMLAFATTYYTTIAMQPYMLEQLSPAVLKAYLSKVNVEKTDLSTMLAVVADGGDV